MDPKLTDGAVVVRPARVEHADALFEAAMESVAEVYPWLPWCRPDYRLDETVTWLAMQEEAWHNGTCFEFGIFDVEGRYLGGAGLNQLNRMHDYANLGYWVRTGAAGRGIATAAARLIAAWGFETLLLKRIEILAAVGNLASQRVAEKVGATREGVLRNRLYIHGVSHDAVMTSLIPEDIR